MKTHWRTYRTILVAAIGILVMLPSSHAAATEATVDADVDAVATYLAAHPGGTPINDNEISYSDGAFVVTLTAPRNSIAGTPDCPSSWYCFYERDNFGFPRGMLSACGLQYLAQWDWDFRIRSVYYPMWYGYAVYYYNGIELFRVGPGARALSTVRWPELATYVKRFC